MIPLPVIASHSLLPPCPFTLGEKNPERINDASISPGSREEPGRWLRGLTLWVPDPSGLGGFLDHHGPKAQQIQSYLPLCLSDEDVKRNLLALWQVSGRPAASGAGPVQWSQWLSASSGHIDLPTPCLSVSVCQAVCRPSQARSLG